MGRGEGVGRGGGLTQGTNFLGGGVLHTPPTGSQHAGTRGSGGMHPQEFFLKCCQFAFPHKMHISASRYFYILPLDYGYGSLVSAAFANGKFWVGSDNQVHDAPSHNCVHDRIIMLKLENFEI